MSEAPHHIARVVDFETTDIGDDAVVCEVGYADVRVRDGVAVPPDEYHSALVSIGVHSIEPGAQATHHISEDDIRLYGQSKDIWFRRLGEGDPAPTLYVAHNAEFEQRFYKPRAPWVCTLKAAHRLWPDAPGHSNQCLRYWLGLGVDRDTAEPAHRAGPDAYVTGHLFAHMLNGGARAADMVRWSREPTLLHRCQMRQHRGKTWAEVAEHDPSYLRWIVDKSECDADVKYTARYHLQLRDQRVRENA